MKKKEDRKSPTSPVGGKRGCLCKDGSYSSECCNGDFHNQGIGNIDTTTTTTSTTTNGVTVTVSVTN